MVAEGSHATFTMQAPEVPVEVVLRMQGYRDMARVRSKVRAIATAAVTRAQDLLAPVAVYRRVPILSCDETTLTVGPGVTFHSREFHKILSGCREAVVFVLTLGEDLDNETLRLIETDDIVAALFVETAGWYAVEQATRSFTAHLWSLVEREGARLTRRLGPGYQDWDLTEQTAFFSLFDGIPLPVRLLESCAMLPKKSRSGLFGVQPAA